MSDATAPAPVFAPRCCRARPEGDRIQDEFAPCYASVLVYGEQAFDRLKEDVERLERGSTITSCFTGWCSRCKGNYLLTPDLQRFPSSSAHHTHKLALLKFLRDEGVFL
jgi:hypothetical protein